MAKAAELPTYLAPAWIPINEHLPQGTAHVLGVTASGSIDIYPRSSLIVYSKDKRKDMRVTHWMPLPPTPNAIPSATGARS